MPWHLNLQSQISSPGLWEYTQHSQSFILGVLIWLIPMNDNIPIHNRILKGTYIFACDVTNER